MKCHAVTTLPITSLATTIPKSGNSKAVLHCASLVRTIFASLARANERVQVYNERNFPQGKLDSEIKARFGLHEHGNLYFLSHYNSVHIILIN